MIKFKDAVTPVALKHQRPPIRYAGIDYAAFLLHLASTKLILCIMSIDPSGCGVSAMVFLFLVLELERDMKHHQASLDRYRAYMSGLMYVCVPSMKLSVHDKRLQIHTHVVS